MKSAFQVISHLFRTEHSNRSYRDIPAKLDLPAAGGRAYVHNYL